MVLTPAHGGREVRVLCAGKEAFSLRDATYLDFAELCFAYRAARRHQAVGIDDILVAVERPPAQDTTPPVTSHDYEHEHEWVNKPVTIHLTATDEGSGVAATYYRINNGPVRSGTEIVISRRDRLLVGGCGLEHRRRKEAHGSWIPLRRSSAGHLYLVRPVLSGYDANEFLVPSADGSALYRLNAVGRHLGTINALTGATIHVFHSL
ncbi:MAG: hypothetical protein GX493_00130 [Firmicutes bacterium]|nr:hypothetical protein [Bacillota bacterium]